MGGIDELFDKENPASRPRDSQPGKGSDDQSNLDWQKQNWLSRFGSSLGETEARKQFERWTKLQGKCAELQEVLSQYQSLDLSKAKTLLDRADNVLRPDRDYQVVVIGETGAGKSSLLNALLQERLLLTGGGAAITGTAIYVYPNQDVDFDKAELSIRTQDEFKPLLLGVASYYLDEQTRANLFGDEASITAAKVIDLANNKDIAKNLPDNFPVDEILDIANTWEKIDTIKKSIKIKFQLPEDQKELNTYLEEGGSRNGKENPERVIPAIKCAKYYLKPKDSSYLNGKTSSNVVFIDVPGSAAKTLRHTEILRQELKNANAVVFVVNPNRPAEKEGTSIANLLVQYLFSGYTAEEKSKFANRVFIVVNKADQIKSEEDETRLKKSLSELCGIIGDTNLLESRYFRIVAEKSVLALILRQKIGLTHESEKNFYATLAKCPPENLGEANPNKLDEESGIPSLLKELNTFLSKDRVKLMLDEGELFLEKAENDIKLTCCQILGLEHQEISSEQLDGLGLTTKVFCDQTLEQDRKELEKARKALIEFVKAWIDSKEHQGDVSSKVTSIFTKLKDSIEEPAKRLLDPEDRDGALHITLSHVTGKSYPNVDSPFLLLSTEEKFHRAVEENSRDLADYYFHKFDDKVRDIKIGELIEQKSYEQKYIKELALDKEIQESKQQVYENFLAICKWVLMYELVKMPIDLPLNPSGDDVSHNLSVKVFQETFREIAPELVLLSSDAIQSMVGILPLPLNKLIEVFARLVKQKVEEPTDEDSEKKPPKPTESKQNLAEKLLDKIDLEKKVAEYGKINDTEKLTKLLQEQFAFRYSVAVSTALIYLERLFRYELGKYYQKLGEINNRLIGMHQSAVNLNHEDILKQLGKKHTDMSQKFEDALNCLKRLLELSTM
ncbi:dynamin family protein [Microcystis aeruginosa BLCCF158]|uniref:Dynamin family protein n=1 Tax=Microcystis aeruginosa BLCC-F158 TaxID=2755316 RepID=A0A841UTI9_MICAE|nr:dynamin family protein [Microcystis aeruginosa]MBC1193872.1 dynamin family protein [Microcystis aeruginosa BLCC-F158]